jgi:hypothetical protein
MVIARIQLHFPMIVLPPWLPIAPFRLILQTFSINLPLKNCFGMRSVVFRTVQGMYSHFVCASPESLVSRSHFPEFLVDTFPILVHDPVRDPVRYKTPLSGDISALGQ